MVFGPVTFVLLVAAALAGWWYAHRFTRGIVRTDERAAALQSIAERAIATLHAAGHRPATVTMAWTHRYPTLKVVMRTEAELSALQAAPVAAEVAAEVAASIRADGRFGAGRSEYRPQHALSIVQLSEAP